MKKTLALFIAAIWLSACAPSVQTIQSAIAQTQAANQPPTIPANLSGLQSHLADFLLLNSDLPIDGQYRRFVYSPFSIPNKDVSSAYVEETGRMDGWGIYYIKSSKDAPVPQEIHGKVVLYTTNAGAQRSINKYSNNLVSDFGYLEETQAPRIGDETRAFILQYQKNPLAVHLKSVIGSSFLTGMLWRSFKQMEQKTRSSRNLSLILPAWFLPGFKPLHV